MPIILHLREQKRLLRCKFGYEFRKLYRSTRVEITREIGIYSYTYIIPDLALDSSGFFNSNLHICHI